MSEPSTCLPASCLPWPIQSPYLLPRCYVPCRVSGPSPPVVCAHDPSFSRLVQPVRSTATESVWRCRNAPVEEEDSTKRVLHRERVRWVPRMAVAGFFGSWSHGRDGAPATVSGCTMVWLHLLSVTGTWRAACVKVPNPIHPTDADADRQTRAVLPISPAQYCGPCCSCPAPVPSGPSVGLCATEPAPLSPQLPPRTPPFSLPPSPIPRACAISPSALLRPPVDNFAGSGHWNQKKRRHSTCTSRDFLASGCRGNRDGHSTATGRERRDEQRREQPREQTRFDPTSTVRAAIMLPSCCLPLDLVSNLLVNAILTTYVPT